tara:strand:+ start:6728 stop:10192 length:3465 start_codon:yes stop_codon:yes gene_type:complete
MANRKVFTDFQFEGGAQLKFPIAHSDVTEPASKGPGQLWFNSAVGGDPEVGIGTLSVQYAAMSGTSDFRALLTAGVPFTTGGLVTFNNNPPFAVGNSTKITNLNADLLDGKHISESALTGAIPVYDSGAALLVGAPTEGGHATPRSYVDNAIQGLDHKASARFTTTDQINLTGLSSQSDLDGTPIAGDRILVKDQDVTTQNGIYIASASGWTRATDTDGLATELVLGGSFSATADITDGTPDNWRSVNSAVLTSEGSGVSGNCLRVQTASGNDGAAYQDITTVIGKAYRISLYMNKGTSGTVAYLVGITSDTDSILGASDTDSTASGWVLHENVFKATATTTRISLVSRDSVGTDYSEFDSVSLREADLTEGAFVFVEEGGTKANTSWVLSDLATSAWTQFSGAGQISVSNVTAATTPAHTTPLFKQGDTISFGYNGGHFGIDGNGNLKIADDGLGAGQIANSAIGAGELDNSASFTMAGLTTDDGYLYLKDGSTGAGLIGPGSKVSAATASDLSIRSSGILEFITNNAWATPVLTISTVGISHFPVREVGIGADAGSPSGTLHVSTARYGSELVTNGTMEADDNWSDLGTIDTNERSTTQKYAGTYSRKLVGVDSGAGIQSDTFSVTAGRKYYVECWAYVTAGDLLVRMQNGNGQNVGSSVNTSATSTWTKISFTHTPTVTGSACFFKFYQNGPTAVTGYVDAVTIREDNLAAGVDSNGNDLVVSGNDATGISIIGQAAQQQSLLFGDGTNNDYSQISSSKNLTTNDSNIFLKASNSNSLATVMTLYGHDKSVKIEGGLGVGVGYAAGSGTLAVKGAADDGIHVWKSDGSVRIAMLEGDGTEDGVLILKNSNGTTKASFSSNSTSYFNGGNVAIGATSGGDSNTKLYLTNGDAAANLQVSSSTTTGILAINHGTDVVIGSTTDHPVTFKSNNTTRLVLGTNGVQDHKGYATVNSSTVQGLQDGACYDFDGVVDTFIDLGDSFQSTFRSSFSIALWVKPEDGQPSATQIFCGSENSTDQDTVYVGITTAGNTVFKYQSDNDEAAGISDSAVFSNGQNDWHHVVCTADSGGNLVTYVNGVVVDTTAHSCTFADWTSSDEFYLGAHDQNGSAANRFTGQIRDFKLFPSALEAGDVRKLYSWREPEEAGHRINLHLV